MFMCQRLAEQEFDILGEAYEKLLDTEIFSLNVLCNSIVGQDIKRVSIVCASKNFIIKTHLLCYPLYDYVWSVSFQV